MDDDDDDDDDNDDELGFPNFSNPRNHDCTSG